jgi:hypothetical protein
MAIPESQLEIWSHQGAITTSKNTYASVKGNLEASDAPYASRSFDICLQGSYGNDTNIRADSDVDIVIQLNSTFHRDLSKLTPEQVQAYQQAFSNATYTFSEFRRDVITQLQRKYGSQEVTPGNKSIKLHAAPGRLGSDIVVCCEYRDYHLFRSVYDQRYDEGIFFITPAGHNIINYPKLHSKNSTAKHQNTGGLFKPMARILKNMRGCLVDDGIVSGDIAPSYFIEGLLYNVPDEKFSGDFGETFCSCVNWFLQVDRSEFVCPNRKHWLFGTSSVQWDEGNCTQFLSALTDLWNGW